jgi:uncharacterized Zn finger protein
MDNNPMGGMPGFTYEQTEALTCDECGNAAFEPAFLLRKVSALVSPSGKETVVPIQLFACNNCGHINEDMLPSDRSK